MECYYPVAMSPSRAAAAGAALGGPVSPASSPTSSPRPRVGLLHRSKSASNLEAAAANVGSPRSTLFGPGVPSSSGSTRSKDWFPPPAAVKAISAPPSRPKPAIKQRVITQVEAPVEAAPPSRREENAGGAEPKPFTPTGRVSQQIGFPTPPAVNKDVKEKDSEEDIDAGNRKKEEKVRTKKDPASKAGAGAGAVVEYSIDNMPKDSEAFWDYQFLFKSQRLEVATPIRLEVVHGKVPADLTGAYYLCGPGIFTDDHGSNIHPLDGHGYLRKFNIRDGAVEYSAKYIDTEARQAEYDESSDEWKFVYRGPFSVLKGGLRFGNAKVMKNTANTSVLKWGNKLMCFWEGGQPYEMDPQSLDTHGLFSMTAGPGTTLPRRASVGWNENPVGRLKSLAAQVEKLWEASMSAQEVANALHIAGVSLTAKLLQPILNGMYAMPEERTLAHVKVDNKTERLVIITCRAEDMILPISTFTVYEFDTDLELQERREFVLPQQLMVHDWALTDNYYVLVANRVKLSPTGCVGALVGFSPMISAITTDDSLPFTPVYLLPRTPAAEQGRDWRLPFRIPHQFWLLHTANSYEERDEQGRLRIVLDGSFCSYHWFSLDNMFGYRWQNRRLDHAFMNTTNRADNSAAHLTRICLTVAGSDPDPVKMADFRIGALPACDFPTINPHVAGHKHKFVYVAASSGHRPELLNFPFDCIVKLDGPTGRMTFWWAGDRTFVGEPVFVPRRGAPTDPTSPHFREDHGYLLLVQYAAAQKTCYLVILDAQKIGKRDPVVTRLRVPKDYAFPMGFHGFWDDY